MAEAEKPNWLERLSHFLLREPDDREQLVELLHASFEKSLLDADALAMIIVGIPLYLYHWHVIRRDKESQ